MKKLLGVFVLFIGTADVFGQSMLHVRFADNSRFNLEINGRYFDKRGKSLTVGDLPTGRHQIKIYSVAYDRWGKPYDKPVYQGIVRTYWGTMTYFSYDPYSREVVTHQELYDDASKYEADQPSAEKSRVEERYRELHRTNEPQAETAQRSEYRKSSPVEDSRVVSPVPNRVAMGSFSEREEGKLKYKVDMRETDTDKLKVIKSGLRREKVSTYQVGQIMDWLLFESTRVEFAKWVYSNVVDKESFSSLYEKMSYKSSKEELRQFVARQR